MISNFIKPIVIHTNKVTVEIMMINGTKYPLNLSASCWIGAYKKKERDLHVYDQNTNMQNS